MTELESLKEQYKRLHQTFYQFKEESKIREDQLLKVIHSQQQTIERLSHLIHSDAMTSRSEGVILESNTTASCKQQKNNNHNNATQKRSSSFFHFFESLNIKPLTHIGLNKNRIQQIFEKNIINSSDLQKSIDAFAFELKYNSEKTKLIKSPIGYFMKTILDGGVINFPKNYVSPQELQKREETIRKSQSLDKSQKTIKDSQVEKDLQSLKDNCSADYQDLVDQAKKRLKRKGFGELEEIMLESEIFSVAKENLTIT